jgi:hypothetical protein
LDLGIIDLSHDRKIDQWSELAREKYSASIDVLEWNRELI